MLNMSFPDVHLLQQAFDLSVVGTVIVDARQDDLPLAYVNPAFEQLSGYSADELLGRNCRFLQGDDLDQPGARELGQAIAQGQSLTVTLRNYQKNGTLFFNELTIHPIRDEADILTHFIGFQNDVTAREEAQKFNTQARQAFSLTLQQMSDGFVALDVSFNYSYVNAAAARLFERRPVDLIGRNLFLVFPEFADSLIFQAIQRAQATGTSQSVDNYLTTSGSWIDVTVHPSEDGISLFTREVTERHQSQEKLRVSEERFSKVFDASPMPMVMTKVSDQRLTEVNEAFLQQTGYRREEVIGRSSQELDLWVEQQTLDRLTSMLEDSQPVQTRAVRLRTKAREELDIILSMVLIALGGEAYVVSLVHDMTHEKRGQRILQESEQRYRRIAAELQRTLDLSLDLIASISTDGRFITMNAASGQILGYAPEELLGRSYLDFVHPDDWVQTVGEDRSITADSAITNFQNRYLHKNGTVVWLEWTAVMLPQDSLMYCVARDITQRRRAEEDQAYLAAIVHASQDAILGVALDGTIQSWNAGAEQLYGYAAPEAVGQPVTFIIPLEFQSLEREALRRAGQEERVYPFESLRVAKDGRLIPVLVTVSSILDAAGQVIGMSKISQDITARRAAAAQIQELNASLQQRLRHLTGLQKIDQAISSSQDLSVTLGLVLDNAVQQLGADAVTLLLLNPQTLTLEYAGTRGLTTPLLGAAVKLGNGLAGEVALGRQPIHVNDLQVTSVLPSWRALLDKERLVAYYGAPLIAKGKVLGVIEVLHREPFDPPATWLETLEMLTGQAAIAVENAQLVAELERKNLELLLAYDQTIEGWAQALDLRDKETEGHSRRVTEMAVELCQTLGLPAERLVDVRRGALLHDIGKMGIPDAVLLKPGALTDEEWILMRKHPEYAVKLLSPIKFLRPALDIPQYHHEKWDGSGYPLGLTGEAIPLTARAFAVVDVYDALTSNRPYRGAWRRERALEHIQAGAETHFDPLVVQAFLNMLKA